MSSRRKNEDKLSCLPDEVLSHILSLMPTRFAVRTSILSKRWKYSWTLVTNLDFDDDHPTYGLDYFSKFVDRVLEHCKTPQLKLFRLGISRLSVQKSDVSKWIDKAIRLKVCELVCPPELPLSLFTSKTLTKLIIYGISFDLDFFDVASPVIMLPALKTLYLCDCKPSRKVFKFIHGCPVLESLSLLFWPDNEEDYYFNIPTLKRLGLEILSYSFVSKFVLNVPNLEYLHVSGMLCSLFVIEDLSSLVKATVSFCLSTEEFNHLNTELLKVISGAKSISWSAPSLDLKDFLHSPLPKFPNLKRLELKGPFQSPWFLVVQILESTSELEHFCFEEPEGSCWIEPQSVPTCMLSNLKTMKITKCKGRNCDIQFLEYILGNAEVLETLTIICGSLRMKDEMNMCSRLLKFPRASRYCEIHFVGKWLNSIGN